MDLYLAMAWYRMHIHSIQLVYSVVMLHPRRPCSVQLVHSTNPAILNEYDKQDPTSLPPSVRSRFPVDYPENLTIGIPKEYNLPSLHPAMSHAWSVAISSLQSSGHTIIPISLPRTKEALSAYYVLATAEAASNLARYDGVRYGYHTPQKGYRDAVHAAREHALGDEVRRRILLGNYTLSAR
jgi:aspartyl-tRNA(Asn)/glutamyl-tRNA(Gln) amidotransferase subunit A